MDRGYAVMMALRAAVARFEPHEVKQGNAWFVHASWSNGRTADVGNFESEAEAVRWIESESTAWLAARLTHSHD
jgi:hypothetical protein